MKSIVACLIVGILCLLCSVSGAENEVAEYERSGSCNVFKLCIASVYNNFVYSLTAVFSRVFVQIPYSSVHIW